MYVVDKVSESPNLDVSFVTKKKDPSQQLMMGMVGLMEEQDKYIPEVCQECRRLYWVCVARF